MKQEVLHDDVRQQIPELPYAKIVIKSVRESLKQ